MLISDKKVVSFHYTLSNEEGKLIESSHGRQPTAYLHGSNNIIPGLEKAMAGKAAGDQFKVTIPPAEAYGERQPNRLQRIPSKHFSDLKRLRPGQAVSIQTRGGPMRAIVVKVGRFNVDVDTNHPLAGQTLTFDVEVMGVRDASETEISHGHVHGPGGVEH